MRRVTVAVACSSLLALAGAASALDAKVERGKEVYVEKKCKVCHSVGGVGNPKGPLDDVATKNDAATLKEWLTDPKGMAAKHKSTRKPPMKPVADKLSADDMDALIAYLSTLKK